MAGQDGRAGVGWARQIGQGGGWDEHGWWMCQRAAGQAARTCIALASQRASPAAPALVERFAATPRPPAPAAPPCKRCAAPARQQQHQQQQKPSARHGPCNPMQAQPAGNCCRTGTSQPHAPPAHLQRLPSKHGGQEQPIRLERVPALSHHALEAGRWAGRRGGQGLRGCHALLSVLVPRGMQTCWVGGLGMCACRMKRCWMCDMTSRRSPAAVLEAAELFRRVPGSWGHCCASAVTAKQHYSVAWPSGRRCGGGWGGPCEAQMQAHMQVQVQVQVQGAATEHTHCIHSAQHLTGTSFTQCSPRQLMTTAAGQSTGVCQAPCATHLRHTSACQHGSGSACSGRQRQPACGLQSALPGSRGRISLVGGQCTYWVAGCWLLLLEAAACARARSSWA